MPGEEIRIQNQWLLIIDRGFIPDNVQQILLKCLADPFESPGLHDGRTNTAEYSICVDTVYESLGESKSQTGTLCRPHILVLQASYHQSIGQVQNHKDIL